MPESPEAREKRLAYLRAYHATHREKALAAQRAWYLAQRDNPDFKAKKAAADKAYVAAHPEQRKSYRKGHHDKNREHDNAVNRAWYAANREKRREQIRAYEAANRDKARKRSAEWYRKNTARRYAKYRAWVAANPEAFRAGWQRRYAREKNAAGSFTTEDLQRQHEKQQGACFYCAADIRKRFEVDHYIPLSKGGSSGPENIVLACRSCNRSKGSLSPEEFLRRLSK